MLFSLKLQVARLKGIVSAVKTSYTGENDMTEYINEDLSELDHPERFLLICLSCHNRIELRLPHLRKIAIEKRKVIKCQW